MRWLLLVLVLGGQDVKAEPCITLPETVVVLAEKYHERLHGAGLTGKGLVLYLFTTDSGSTWTAVTFAPNGCAVGSVAGEAWTELAKGQRT